MAWSDHSHKINREGGAPWVSNAVAVEEAGGKRAIVAVVAEEEPATVVEVAVTTRVLAHAMAVMGWAVIPATVVTVWATIPAIAVAESAITSSSFRIDKRPSSEKLAGLFY